MIRHLLRLIGWDREAKKESRRRELLQRLDDESKPLDAILSNNDHRAHMLQLDLQLLRRQLHMQRRK